MKGLYNRTMWSILLASFLVIFLAACSEEDEPIPVSGTKKTVVTNVQEGVWIISKFEDSGVDETNDFAGFGFVFGPNNVLTATKGTIVYTGNWSVSKSGSDDDSPLDLDFNIFFNLTNEFEDLNDDWDILTQSDSLIELKDVSGGNGGTDLLSFSKQ